MGHAWVQWVRNGSRLGAVGTEWVTPECSVYGMGHAWVQWVRNGSRMRVVGTEWITPVCRGYGMGHAWVTQDVFK